jgi:hypothetical protein
MLHCIGRHNTSQVHVYSVHFFIVLTQFLHIKLYQMLDGRNLLCAMKILDELLLLLRYV